MQRLPFDKRDVERILKESEKPLTVYDIALMYKTEDMFLSDFDDMLRSVHKRLYILVRQGYVEKQEIKNFDDYNIVRKKKVHKYLNGYRWIA